MCTFGPGGEMQQAEVEIPVISHKYTMDLSRTRSYFVPGYPVDVVVCMKLTNWQTDMHLTDLFFYEKYILSSVFTIGGHASPRWLPSSWCASKS